MSKDDSNGGFLSKVVKFVRHPTTNWSDLDSRVADRESHYSKAALKEMIERKRRNDFVRKREFDALRKIRSREVSGGESRGLRPSFFQSSLQSKPDDRAVTLKKIDEIEAQMSMQWWKTKGHDSRVTGTSMGSPSSVTGGASATRGGDASESRADVAEQDKRLAQQYTTTEAGSLAADPDLMGPLDAWAPGAAGSAMGRNSEVASSELELPTQAGALSTLPAHRTGLMAMSAPQGRVAGSDSMFSASHFFELDVQEIAQDPEIEEAAIRFANGDDPGAEQVILEALGDGRERVNQQDDWFALFDFYRATGQLAPFESHAVDFANRFHRSAPQWYDMPGKVTSLTGKVCRPASGPNRVLWACEPAIDAHAVGTLQSVLARASQPWVLDWSPVESIDFKAARALLGMFTLWGDQEVDLRFGGTTELRDLLKALTPSGRRDVEQVWWELRMAALRLMNQPDEFELTALDFCVTYEVSPPGWEPPRCHFQAISNDDSAGTGTSVLGDVVLEQVPAMYSGDTVMDGQASEFNHLGLVELSGEIRGDPQDILTALEQRLEGADVLIISCRNLIRVDFSAAGTLLNWVSGHHAEGRMVQFVEAHRLVSAFFHVIGITEYAKVVLRND